METDDQECSCRDLISAQVAGSILRPSEPLAPSSARTILGRAGIKELRGYPRAEVEGLALAREAMRKSKQSNQREGKETNEG